MATITERNHLIHRIDRRIADMTDLSVGSTENLQVISYDVGGSADPHVDFLVNQNTSISLDNRLATVQFYVCGLEHISLFFTFL